MRHLLCSLVCFISMLTASPAFATAPIQPVSALFYPHEVHLTVEQTLSPVSLPSGQQGYLLCIPAQARESSFVATLNDQPVVTFSFLYPPQRIIAHTDKTRFPEAETDMARKTILENLLQVEKEVAARNGRLIALQAQHTLWADTTGTAPASAEERQKLATLQGSELPALVENIATEQKRQQEAENHRLALENELALYDQRHDTIQVAIPVPVQSSSSVPGTPAPAATLRYSYTIPGGFQPAYTLAASPDTGTLRIDQTAILHHTFPETWTNVDIALSTVQRRQMEPPFPRPWRIGEESNFAPQEELQNVQEFEIGKAFWARPYDNQEPIQQADEFVAKQRVRTSVSAVSGVQEKTSFKTYSLGKQTLTPQHKNRVLLTSQEYKAEYLYTIRPETGTQGFLTATLQLKAPLELPRGMAQVLIDGVLVGMQPFSFYGSKEEIFLGEDPQVTATMRNLSNLAGVQGVLVKDTTLGWNWEIEAKNNRSKAVRIRVEDSAPDIADERIKLKVQSQPKPVEITLDKPDGRQTKIVRWELTLEPNTSATITHKVECTMPEKAELPRGWR